MSTRYKKQSLYGRLFLPVLTVLVLTYFTFHAVNGRYGYRALQTEQVRIAELLEQRAKLLDERKAMRDRANLLKLAAIDADLLDERARQLLGYVRSDELLIYFNR
ncbi:MAG: septum formation initiator family protein [Alphaproteobacteria bacterium]|nr:septum formation initiator family protein [Alphaproteobacteria bacterium]